MNRTVAHGSDILIGGRPASGTRLGKALGVALALGSAHAWAQSASATPPAENSTPPVNSKLVRLGKVSVQAEDLEPTSPKFTAPLLDTPLSVTILPQSVLEETAATSLQDALRNVPGITFAAGEGATPLGDLPSIRGFSSAENIYVDGMRDIGLQSRDIFDLEQVEVIKGPDSSIAGRSAGGGVINLVSKSAEASDFIETTGTYGSAGQWRATLDGNLALTDGIAARLNFMDMGGGVPGRSGAVRTDKWGIAPTVTFGLHSSTRVILGYYHFEDKSTPDYGIPVDYQVTGLPLSETRGVSTENFYGLADRDFRRAPVDAGEVSVEHDFSDSWTLRTQARYTDSQNDYVLTLPEVSGADEVYRLPIANRDRTRGVISETNIFGHFDTGPVHHSLDAGFEYSHEKEELAGEGSYDGYTVVSSAGVQGFSSSGDCSDPALVASYDCTSLLSPDPYDPWRGTITPTTFSIADFTTSDWAPYVFDTMTFSPHWKANAGVRFDRYHTESADPANALINAEEASTYQESSTSYQVSLMYKPVSAGTIYLMTSTSFIPEDEANGNLSGGGSGQDQVLKSAVPPQPEKTRTVELGSKWSLFHERLLVSGDVFTEDHLNAPIAIAPGITEQVGKTRVRGAEVSANGSITENWNIIAGYSYLDAKVLRGGYASKTIGQQLPNTPPSTFSLWSTYRVIPAVTVGGGAYYRDKQIGYAAAVPEYIGAYWRFDAMAKWQVDSRFAVQLNVQNLFDEQYFSKTFFWYAIPAPERTWLLTADFKL